jgi:hypothetical protein
MPAASASPRPPPMISPMTIADPLEFNELVAVCSRSVPMDNGAKLLQFAPLSRSVPGIAVAVPLPASVTVLSNCRSLPLPARRFPHWTRKCF